METETEIQKGFIGFFDILGYQSILENHNDPSEIAKGILSKLNSLITSIINEIIKFAPIVEGSTIQLTYHEHLKCLVFSDTILFSMAIPEDIEEKEKSIRWTTFIVACIFLQRTMLSDGLPLRGAITYGSYLIDKTCFAGKPIVDAYKLAQTIDLSACVFDDDAYEEGNKISTEPKAIIKYLVPQKDGKDVKRPTLNYVTTMQGEDIRDIVFRSFLSFNKDVPTNVQQKVLNTEQHIRFLSQKNQDFDK